MKGVQPIKNLLQQSPKFSLDAHGLIWSNARKVQRRTVKHKPKLVVSATEKFKLYIKVFAIPGYPSTVTRSPISTPLGGTIISTLSGELAHMIIPSDSTPRILAGFRFRRNTAMQFFI